PLHDNHPALHVLFSMHHSATTELYTLSLHDALPICDAMKAPAAGFLHATNPSRQARFSTERGASYASCPRRSSVDPSCRRAARGDRKSTRLNSSHQIISYAVFCLKKKNQHNSISTHE